MARTPTFLVRLSPDLYNKIKKLAVSGRRSITAQTSIVVEKGLAAIKAAGDRTGTGSRR